MFAILVCIAIFSRQTTNVRGMKRFETIRKEPQPPVNLLNSLPCVCVCAFFCIVGENNKRMAKMSRRHSTIVRLDMLG